MTREELLKIESVVYISFSTGFRSFHPFVCLSPDAFVCCIMRDVKSCSAEAVLHAFME